MTLARFRAQNHPQQNSVRGGGNPVVDDRATPVELFAPLHKRFRFTLDAAASAHNAKMPRYFTAEQDGLAQSWTEERVWCNPPYSNLRPWIEKAWGEYRAGCNCIVLLAPANRTEQGWWQDLVEPVRDRSPRTFRVEFIAGRQRFIAAGRDVIGPNERPPFGVCLLIWNRGD